MSRARPDPIPPMGRTVSCATSVIDKMDVIINISVYAVVERIPHRPDLFASAMLVYVLLHPDTPR